MKLMNFTQQIRHLPKKKKMQGLVYMGREWIAAVTMEEINLIKKTEHWYIACPSRIDHNQPSIEYH